LFEETMNFCVALTKKTNFGAKIKLLRGIFCIFYTGYEEHHYHYGKKRHCRAARLCHAPGTKLHGKEWPHGKE
jgi:hypothetical protein